MHHGVAAVSRAVRHTCACRLPRIARCTLCMPDARVQAGRILRVSALAAFAAKQKNPARRRRSLGGLERRLPQRSGAKEAASVQ
eukprot:9207202-Alexandrium_andersonii.AAC.1